MCSIIYMPYLNISALIKYRSHRIPTPPLFGRRLVCAYSIPPILSCRYGIYAIFVLLMYIK